MTTLTVEGLEALQEKVKNQIKVKGPRILIEIEKTELEKKTSILHIAEDALNREKLGHVVGRVLQVGDTCFNLPSQKNPATGNNEPWCKVGDRVVYGQYAGSKILMKGAERLVVINDEDVIAVLEDNV